VCVPVAECGCPSVSAMFSHLSSEVYLCIWVGEERLGGGGSGVERWVGVPVSDMDIH